MKGFRKRELLRDGFSVSYVRLKNGKVLLSIQSKNILVRKYGEAILEGKDKMFIPLPTGKKIKINTSLIENITT